MGVLGMTPGLSELSFGSLPAALSGAPPGRRGLAPSKGPQGRAPLSPCSLISPSFTCLEPPHLANLTLENASECLMQH